MPKLTGDVQAEKNLHLSALTRDRPCRSLLEGTLRRHGRTSSLGPTDSMESCAVEIDDARLDHPDIPVSPSKATGDGEREQPERAGFHGDVPLAHASGGSMCTASGWNRLGRIDLGQAWISVAWRREAA